MLKCVFEENAVIVPILLQKVKVIVRQKRSLEMATRISCVVELTQRLGSTTARWNRRCNGGVLKVTLLLSSLIHDCPDDNDCELSEEEDCSSHDKTCQMRHNGKEHFVKNIVLYKCPVDSIILPNPLTQMFCASGLA